MDSVYASQDIKITLKIYSLILKRINSYHSSCLSNFYIILHRMDWKWKIKDGKTSDVRLQCRRRWRRRRRRQGSSRWEWSDEVELVFSLYTSLECFVAPTITTSASKALSFSRKRERGERERERERKRLVPPQTSSNIFSRISPRGCETEKHFSPGSSTIAAAIIR